MAGNVATMTLAPELRTMTSVPTDAYVVGATAWWTDDQLTAALLAHRYVITQTPVAVVRSDDYTILAARVAVNGVLETDSGVLVSRAGAELDGWSIDRDGNITFETDVAADPPAHYSGWSYDLHDAASYVLTAWAGAVAMHYDISTDGQSMTRSQKQKQLLELAGWHRGQALVRGIPVKPIARRRRRTYPGFVS